MRNITIAIPDELFQKVRLYAHFTDVSISYMVRRYFESVEPQLDKELANHLRHFAPPAPGSITDLHHRPVICEHTPTPSPQRTAL